jgi:hypothetical protein
VLAEPLPTILRLMQYGDSGGAAWISRQAAITKSEEIGSIKSQKSTTEQTRPP